MRTSKKFIFFALLAALLYALSAPISKLLLGSLSPTLTAALLYLGAGMGMFVLGLAARQTQHHQRERSLTKAELPYIAAMIVLDIAAPILLMSGLKRTTAANTSLLNNFEIVATTLIALTMFKEKISRRLWLGIILVTVASVLLSLEDTGSLHFSIGSLFVLLACVCWGLENNITRKLSDKNPLHIVVIKGLGSGAGLLLIALLLNEVYGNVWHVLAALLLGFVAYGLSIYFYVYAQRHLGAARTSTFYAAAPFFGVALSFILFKEPPTSLFLLALAIMFLGAYHTAMDQLQTG